MHDFKDCKMSQEWMAKKKVREAAAQAKDSQAQARPPTLPVQGPLSKLCLPTREVRALGGRSRANKVSPQKDAFRSALN